MASSADGRGSGGAADRAYGEALAGRTALVTGGSRGIGRATAAALVRAGARTIISARDAEVLDEAARATGAEALPGDITAHAAIDPDVKTSLVAQVVERLGGVPLSTPPSPPICAHRSR